MATIGIDLDGVICSEERTFERSLAKLLPGALESLKALNAAGHVIVIWTARGWSEYRVTFEWLSSQGIPFDQLVMGKPIFDVFIDDRAVAHEEWSTTNIRLAEKDLLPHHKKAYGYS